MRLPIVLLVPALLALLGGCASRQVGDAAPALHRGAVAAAAETEAVFRDSNRSARATDIERVLLRAEQDQLALPDLAERDFVALVEPATAAQWTALFDAITGYTGSLVRLTDPRLAAGAGDQLQAVGNGFGRLAGAPTARVGKVSAIVGAVGEAIVSARAERTAAGVVRRTDPAFNDLLVAMADALASDDPASLRNTVADQWQAGTLSALQTRFGSLPRGPETAAERRRLAEAYVQALAERDRAMGSFTRLRQALLALADAHRAAARDDPASAMAWVDRVDRITADIGRRMGN